MSWTPRLQSTCEQNLPSSIDEEGLSNSTLIIDLTFTHPSLSRHSYDSYLRLILFIGDNYDPGLDKNDCLYKCLRVCPQVVYILANRELFGSEESHRGMIDE